jgi:hypothetical protein
MERPSGVKGLSAAVLTPLANCSSRRLKKTTPATPPPWTRTMARSGCPSGVTSLQAIEGTEGYGAALDGHGDSWTSGVCTLTFSQHAAWL